MEVRVKDLIKELYEWDGDRIVIVEVVPDMEDCPDGYGDEEGFKFYPESFDTIGKGARQVDGKDQDIMVLQFKARDY